MVAIHYIPLWERGSPPTNVEGAKYIDNPGTHHVNILCRSRLRSLYEFPARDEIRIAEEEKGATIITHKKPRQWVPHAPLLGRCPRQVSFYLLCGEI